MTDTMSMARDTLLADFTGAWRDGAPVFACCRRAVGLAVDHADLSELAVADPARRVHLLRAPVERELPGHLASHRCCANHLADLAFDAPEMLAEPVRTA